MNSVTDRELCDAKLTRSSDKISDVGLYAAYILGVTSGAASLTLLGGLSFSRGNSGILSRRGGSFGSGVSGFSSLAGLFISLGVEKIRLSGGEPLLRKGLPELISMLALRKVEIAMTTNGVLLPRFAPALSAAGLDRVTVSLDALDEATFAAMTDSGHTVAAVSRTWRLLVG